MDELESNFFSLCEITKLCQAFGTTIDVVIKCILAWKNNLT